MRSFIRHGTVSLMLVTGCLSLTAGGDPGALLTEADRLAGLGNWVKARSLYAQAEQEFHSRGDVQQELYAKFGRLHRDIEAGSYSAVGEEIEKDLQNPAVQCDPGLHIRALSLKGFIDLNTNTAAAEDDFSQILVLAKSIDDRKWENRASGELGIISGINGDIGTAGMTLFKAMNTASALHDLAGEISFATWLANGMAVHGMADRAISMLDRPLELVRQNADAGFPVQLYIAKIRALLLLPEGGKINGREEAKRLIDQALTYARENNILGAQAELLNQAGLLAMNANDVGHAEAAFRETVDVAGKAQLPRMEAEGYLHLSEVYEHDKDQSKAIEAIDSGIDQLHLVQEDFDLPVYLARKAELESGQGHVRSADMLYTQAEELIEAMLVNAPSSHVKSSMISALGNIYVGHFDLALSKFNDPRKAFQIIETARGRAVADSIRYANRYHPAAGLTPPEREITALQVRLRATPSPKETKLLLAKLDRAYDQLAPVEYERNQAEMRVLREPPVTIRRLQSSLAPGEALLEYVLDSKENSHAIEITSTTVHVHTLPRRDEISTLVQNYVRALKSKANWLAPGQALFEKVVLPALSTNPDSVIVVPDGSLHLVPFAAVPDKSGHPWMKSVAVTLAPSATVFHMLRISKRTTDPPRPFLGVAYSPEHHEGGAQNQQVATRGIDSQISNLKPLPFAREEVQAAARVAGKDSVLLVDDAASESAVKSQPLQDFRIIHLAAHGFGNLTEPDRAGLVLATGDPKEDGLWQAREIRQSRLAADLVTLSACETGTGRLQGEEGIMNLARTFLIAGAKSVVASLWDVDDRSTATLMTHFYQQIANGNDITQALRQAQLGMLTEFGADMQPYYWAGFTVIGDGRRKINFTQASTTNLRAAGKHIR
jgi:CHAT domain-containing protein